MAGRTFPDFAIYSCCEACCPSGITAQVVDAAAAGLCGCVQGTSCCCGCCNCCSCCKTNCIWGSRSGCGSVQGASCGYQTLGTQTNCCGKVDPIWGCRPSCCGGSALNPCCCGYTDPLNPCCPFSGYLNIPDPNTPV